MKQILSHYQAVLPLQNDIEKFIDISDLVYQVLFGAEYTDEQVKELNNKYKHIIADVIMDRQDDEVGRISFTREAQYFPTMYPESCGCRIMYKGKEYLVGYDAEDRLTIGFNNTLFCFDDHAIEDDCETIYLFIFQGIIPEQTPSMEKEDA